MDILNFTQKENDLNSECYLTFGFLIQELENIKGLI